MNDFATAQNFSDFPDSEDFQDSHDSAAAADCASAQDLPAVRTEGIEAAGASEFLEFLESVEALDREKLLLEHLPAVRYIARRLHERLPQHVELDDLVSAGVVGLIDACSKFDAARHVQFKSYAQFRIRGAILDSLRLLDWSPRELRRKGRAVEEAIRTLTQRLGRAPVEQEIAAEMELSLEQMQQLLGDLKGLEIGSLNEEHSEESGDAELAYVPAAPEEDPLFRCLEGESRQQLIDAIEELPEKERLVLTLYYYEELTMREIGLTLGVVESRVSQIHASAVRQLRVLLGAGTETRGKSGGKRARAAAQGKRGRRLGRAA